jgi:hypothetical protein
MTREEAIELLEDVIGCIEDNQGRDYDTAFRMAIEALKAKPPTEGKYEKAIKTLQEMPKYINSNIIGKKLEVLNYTKGNKNGEINEK